MPTPAPRRRGSWRWSRSYPWSSSWVQHVRSHHRFYHRSPSWSWTIELSRRGAQRGFSQYILVTMWHKCIESKNTAEPANLLLADFYSRRSPLTTVNWIIWVIIEMKHFYLDCIHWLTIYLNVSWLHLKSTQADVVIHLSSGTNIVTLCDIIIVMDNQSSAYLEVEK